MHVVPIRARPFHLGQCRRCNDHERDSHQRPCLCEHVLKSSRHIILLAFRQGAFGTGRVDVEGRELFRLAARDERRSLESRCAGSARLMHLVEDFQARVLR